MLLLALGHCDSGLISPRNHGPGAGGSGDGQEKREQGDSDKLAETPGRAEPWREKDLCLNFIYKSSITKIITFSSEHGGSHVPIPTKICFVGEVSIC